MTLVGWTQIVLFCALVIATTRPLGGLMARVFAGERTFLSPVLGRVERDFYRLAGVKPEAEQHWTTYALAMLLFDAAGFLLLFALQRLQAVLPFNPQGFGPVAPDLAFNTAVSFVTNTNWQNYGGETTMSLSRRGDPVACAPLIVFLSPPPRRSMIASPIGEHGAPGEEAQCHVAQEPRGREGLGDELERQCADENSGSEGHHEADRARADRQACREQPPEDEGRARQEAPGKRLEHGSTPSNPTHSGRATHLTSLERGKIVVRRVAGSQTTPRAERTRLAPVLARPQLAYGILAGLFLLFIWWGPYAQARRPIYLLVTAVLLVIGLEALRRITAREFPDAAEIEPRELLRRPFAGRGRPPGAGFLARQARAARRTAPAGRVDRRGACRREGQAPRLSSSGRGPSISTPLIRERGLSRRGGGRTRRRRRERP